MPSREIEKKKRRRKRRRRGGGETAGPIYCNGDKSGNKERRKGTRWKFGETMVRIRSEVTEVKPLAFNARLE